MQLFRNDTLLVESESVFVHKCSACEKIMNLSEGDILYNSKWYHKSCWNEVEIEPNQDTSGKFGVMLNHA